MCIIRGRVKKVANTELFAARLEDVSRQLTVYANRVALAPNTRAGAMILPVPVRDCAKADDEIELLDLSAYKTLFKDLDKIWPRKKGKARSRRALASNSVTDTLVVHDVGSYKASIVPTLADFARLDGEVFQFDDEIRSFMAEAYPAGFSFIACVLKKGEHDYAPFAYTHNIVADSGELHLPSLHYHEHEEGKDNHSVADWNHKVYVMNAELSNLREHATRTQTEACPLDLSKLPCSLEPFRTLQGTKINSPAYRHNHDLKAKVN